jgi:hypothetical protein
VRHQTGRFCVASRCRPSRFVSFGGAPLQHAAVPAQANTARMLLRGAATAFFVRWQARVLHHLWRAHRRGFGGAAPNFALKAEHQRHAARPWSAVPGTFSPTRAWRHTVGARLAPR